MLLDRRAVHASPAADERRAIAQEGARFPAGLGKITSRVSPPPWGAGQVAAPFEPAQFDFDRVPLSCAPSQTPPPVREAPSDVAGAQGDLFARQLELPFQAARRARYRLRDALRPVGAPRVSRCGRVRVAPVLEILRGDDGRAHWAGLLTCGSVWACPTCSAAIRTQRAADVQAVVEWHGQDSTYLLSMTLAHAWTDSLRRLRAALSLAWRRMQTGAPWRRFRERVGFVGSVRALEVTHGAKGWHPHLHVLLLVDDVGELEAAREWLQLRWRAAVVRELGARHAPLLGIGLDLRPCREASYVAKLGLELASDGTKAAAGANRTAWQIAHDVARSARPCDVTLWRTYCEGMAGARMLTWSRGLRDRAMLGAERSDDDVARDPADVSREREEERSRRRVCFVDGATWDRVRHVPQLGARLLVAAERGRDVGALLARLDTRKGTGPPWRFERCMRNVF